MPQWIRSKKNEEENTIMAYTFQDFLDGTISVGFTNDKPDEADEFLKRCEAEGIEWKAGCRATDVRPKCEIAYRIVLEGGKLAWESQSWYRFTVPYSQLDMGDGGTYELHISCSDGKTTHAAYKRNGKIIQRTMARCNPDDKFDFAKGVAVAISRLGGFLKEPGKPEATPEGKHIYRMSLADARTALDAGSVDFVPEKDGKTITLRQLLESIGDVFIQLRVGENEEIIGMAKTLCNELCSRRLNQKLGEVKVDNDMLVIRQEE